jgi:hypothetical protein
MAAIVDRRWSCQTQYQKDHNKLIWLSVFRGNFRMFFLVKISLIIVKNGQNFGWENMALLDL